MLKFGVVTLGLEGENSISVLNLPICKSQMGCLNGESGPPPQPRPKSVHR